MYNVAIYCRLSQEDGKDESQSISSQKDIITNYVKSQNWHIYDYYVDDGFSGTNFNRPGFNRLIKDIKLGRVNLVVTKDLFETIIPALAHEPIYVNLVGQD